MSVQALVGKSMELSAHARACCAWGCTTDIERRRHMKRVAFLPVAVVVVAGVVAPTAPPSGRAEEGAAPPRSAREVRGATPYLPVENEPAPKLIVDEPLPEGLPQGIVWIQYRTENCRILPMFGKEALNLSPRVSHLHVHVDDLPWLCADASDTNTVDIGGMPPGEHKVTIELVDPTHQVFPGQSKTVKLTVPKTAPPPH